mmetsp:Transcript_25603/g.60908  ORF Transcript_25603/g.60908 Transcript_25603/m.60908 type:complete len:88 (-) Transcript_25603:2215-2478(-)
MARIYTSLTSRTSAQLAGLEEVSWVVVGLGNPGSAYSGTRHNIGHRFIDALAKGTLSSLTAERDHLKMPTPLQSRVHRASGVIVDSQ